MRLRRLLKGMQTWWMSVLIGKLSWRWRRRLPICLIALCMCFSSAFAQEGPIQSVFLDSAVVLSNSYQSAIKTQPDGTLVWKMQMMDDLPKILGNADPIHYTQLLPGVQTNAEYRSGIHVQGGESSHCAVTIGGVPIYNVNHLLGFFSTFNGAHYSTMEINKSGHEAVSANRLGGSLKLNSDVTLTDRLYGEASLGPMATQGTIHVPVGQKTSVSLSLRASYMNTLYSRWLSWRDAKVGYAFYDANISVKHQLDAYNRLLLDYYGGADVGSFSDPYYQSNISATWGNQMGALHWMHTKGRLQVRNTVYTTNYTNHFSINLSSLEATLPSGIYDLGYKGLLNYGKWAFGAEVIYHTLRPQSLISTGSFNEASTEGFRQQSVEATASCDYVQPLFSNVALSVGMKGPVYVTADRTFCHVDPVCAILYDDYSTRVSLSYALQHQYLFQTGFSDAGLPTEFWFSASGDNLPQYCHGWQLSGATTVFRNAFRVSADVFYKRLFNQIEYYGTVIDLVNKSYSLPESLLHGEGSNAGFSAMLQKVSGALTGWCSYTYTRALRQFVEMGEAEVFPASHERPHELNVVLGYNPMGHWTMGTTMVYASGTPFTAPVSLSLLNGNIITLYGEHNANRLRPYFRLDVSVNYTWKSRRLKQQGVNLSLYNTTCHQNDLFWRINTRYGGGFAYQPSAFVVDILPSISYFCKF